MLLQLLPSASFPMQWSWLPLFATCIHGQKDLALWSMFRQQFNGYDYKFRELPWNVHSCICSIKRWSLIFDSNSVEIINIRGSFHVASTSSSSRPLSNIGSIVYPHFPDLQFGKMVVLLLHNGNEIRRWWSKWWPPIRRWWWVEAALGAYLGCHVSLRNSSRNSRLRRLFCIQFLICIFYMLILAMNHSVFDTAREN